MTTNAGDEVEVIMFRGGECAKPSRGCPTRAPPQRLYVVPGVTFWQRTFKTCEELEDHYETEHADLGGVEGVRAEHRRRVERGTMPHVITAQTQRRLAECLWKDDDNLRAGFCALCGNKGLMPPFTGEQRDGTMRTVWYSRVCDLCKGAHMDRSTRMRKR